MNLMPISICKKLKLLNLRLTTMVIKLANSSIRRLAGILEEFPIQVGKFVIPCDFIVLDMDENSQAPVILGRSSLATAGAVIECRHTHYLSLVWGEGGFLFRSTHTTSRARYPLTPYCPHVYRPSCY